MKKGIILVFVFTVHCWGNILLAQCLSGNCQDGQGEYQFKSGSKFTGLFKDGKMSRGTLYYNNGDVYTGNFQNNERNGHGLYTYKKTGNIFEGTFANGEKIDGKFRYSDGSYYTGNFANNKKNGKGSLHTKSGKIYNGYWKDDQYVGQNLENNVDTYALIIGVADYENFSFFDGDLKFTVNDACLMSDYLKSKDGGNVPEQNIVLLSNKKATSENIMKAGKSLFAKADENDKIIFFFSGHGAPGYFLPYDADRHMNNLLSHDQVKYLFRTSKASTKIIYADACYSGSIKKNIPGINKKNLKNEKGEKTNVAKVTETEVAIMSSSDKEQISIEFPDLNQGVFSYFLIKGLKGKADSNNDNIITIEELYYYVRNNTYDFVKSKTGQKQTPILFGKFDLEMIVNTY